MMPVLLDSDGGVPYGWDASGANGKSVRIGSAT
jgi:hypothetical protein